MPEFISQQFLYQDLASSANYDSEYKPIQLLFVSTNIEVDKGTFVITFNNNVDVYNYTQYFKMRGFNTISEQYEIWTSANFSNLNPPSGNPLTDIVIVSVWFA